MSDTNPDNLNFPASWTDEQKKRAIEHLRRHDELLQSLVDSGRLVLEVRVNTKEQALELIEWLQGKDKPMRTELVSINQDAVVVSGKEKELVEATRRIFNTK